MPGGLVAHMTILFSISHVHLDLGLPLEPVPPAHPVLCFLPKSPPSGLRHSMQSSRLQYISIDVHSSHVCWCCARLTIQHSKIIPLVALLWFMQCDTLSLFTPSSSSFFLQCSKDEGSEIPSSLTCSLGTKGGGEACRCQGFREGTRSSKRTAPYTL